MTSETPEQTIQRLQAEHLMQTGILHQLAVIASRSSASYEYEIDTLRGALRDLVERVDEEAWDVSTGRSFKAALKIARAAIDRTDWRAP